MQFTSLNEPVYIYLFVCDLVDNYISIVQLCHFHSVHKLCRLRCSLQVLNFKLKVGLHVITKHVHHTIWQQDELRWNFMTYQDPNFRSIFNYFSFKHSTCSNTGTMVNLQWSQSYVNTPAHNNFNMLDIHIFLQPVWAPKCHKCSNIQFEHVKLGDSSVRVNRQAFDGIL